MEPGEMGLDKAQGQGETQRLVRSPDLRPGALVRVGSWELSPGSPGTQKQRHEG